VPWQAGATLRSKGYYPADTILSPPPPSLISSAPDCAQSIPLFGRQPDGFLHSPCHGARMKQSRPALRLRASGSHRLVTAFADTAVGKSLQVHKDILLVIDGDNDASSSRFSVDQPTWFGLTASLDPG